MSRVLTPTIKAISSLQYMSRACELCLEHTRLVQITRQPARTTPLAQSMGQTYIGTCDGSQLCKTAAGKTASPDRQQLETIKAKIHQFT